MEDHKKKIAAMTAVLYYLQAEEEAVQYELPAVRVSSQAPEVNSTIKLALESVFKVPK